jgi:ABC-type transporter Mla subunit MlaD
VPAPDLETLAARVAGHDESLRAISDTLVDLTKDVRGLARRMDRLESRVDGLQQTVDQHTATLDRHTATLDQHTATLDQHTGMLAEILHILRAAPDGPLVRGEGDPPSPGVDR